MSYKDALANKRATIRHLIILNIVLGAALLGSTGFNYTLFRGLSISQPPDLRTGALIKPGEKYPEDVFAFTTMVFQSLQNWRINGLEDYEKNIDKVAAFITQDFRTQLKKDHLKKDRNGELEGITRQIALPAEFIFSDDTVVVKNSNEWIVKVPMEIKEYVKGELIKDIEVLYSFIVRRARTDITRNAYQIAIDGYHVPPVRTKDYLSDDVVKQDLARLMHEL